MCAAGLPYQIAIIGAGSIGSALAGHLILAGNKVTIGTRRPDALTPPDYPREDIDYPVRTIEEAIDGAEIAILAIPNAAVAPFAEVYRDRLAGAVIIDPSNPLLWHDGGVITIKDLRGKTSGTVTTEPFPKSSVARAFSHQLAETLWLRGRMEPGRWGIGTRPTTTIPPASPPKSSAKPAPYRSELARWPTQRALTPAECCSPASLVSSARAKYADDTL
jgi:8-hydroxy-5-deazaflavin:NADPH oxidoreductase